MSASIEFRTLLAYNHGETERWHAFFVQHPEALDVEVGGKMPKVRNLVAHIFEVESFFSSALQTDTPEYASLNADSLEDMFAAHETAHAAISAFLETATEDDLQKQHSFPRRPEHKFSGRKLLIQVMYHGVNHWGQVAMLLRRAGIETGPPHDIIISKALQ
ncbi:MAG TPA: DinB family protein [Terriglobales bacterium]